MLCRNSLIRGNHWEIIQLLSLCFNKPYSKFDMPTARLAAAGGQRPPLQFQLSEFPHSFARLPPALRYPRGVTMHVARPTRSILRSEITRTCLPSTDRLYCCNRVLPR